MRLTLHVTAGPGTGRSGTAAPGRPLYVGRGVMAHLRIDADPDLLPVHFEVDCSQAGCRLRDVSGPAGTSVNGTKVRSTELKPGDVVTAGKSTFEVREWTPPVETAPVVVPLRPVAPTAPAVARPVLAALRAEPEPLFAIVDAARDPLAYHALLDCGEEHRSLYDDGSPKGLSLTFVAPYLVRLSPDKPFAEKFLKAGWGHSWGVFLTSRLPFEEVRKHLRHFLMVQVPGGKTVYFRFYDPRVLRVFLPTCTPEELKTFIGPIGAYLMEADEPTGLLRFTARDKPARVAVVPPGG